MIDLDNLSPSKVPSVSEAAKARADVLRTLRVAQRAVRDDFVYAVEYARMQGVSQRTTVCRNVSPDACVP